jgi:hypothetical protein
MRNKSSVYLKDSPSKSALWNLMAILLSLVMVGVMFPFPKSSEIPFGEANESCAVIGDLVKTDGLNIVAGTRKLIVLRVCLSANGGAEHDRKKRDLKPPAHRCKLHCLQVSKSALHVQLLAQMLQQRIDLWQGTR